MAKKQSGLGKGLGALMLENSVDDGLTTSTLSINEITPNSEQPRKTFDEAALQELADSIKQHGILQPLLVRPIPAGGYQLVAGERRWRAARIAGLKEVPVIVKDLSDTEAMELAIIENLQREDLNPIEEAEGLQALADKCGYTQEEIAVSVGKSRSAIANSLRLLNLPSAVRDMAKNGEITAGHARALLGFDDQAMMLACANEIVSRKLTVRDVERMAKKSPSETKKRTKRSRDSFFDEVEIALSNALGRKVIVSNKGNKGTLQIEFYSQEDLKNLANSFDKD